MTSAAYYNENDPFAAAWLRELIKKDLIAPGYVDERSIYEVTIDDLQDFEQCHFFAGIGVWSYALRNAGWPDDKPVWTGSCPCQPFSAAGTRKGFADERNLWPAWEYLIAKRSPVVIFGEQVASKDGLDWFDTVQTDLEGQGYAVGANDLCAAGVGAPHIRQRLFFVAARLGDPECARLQRRGDKCLLGKRSREIETRRAGRNDESGKNESYSNQKEWQNPEWIGSSFGEVRPVEPETFPVAYGSSASMGRLRGYGNAINAEVARVFIESYMEYSPLANIPNHKGA